jgi:hypothetical protein
MEARKAMEEKDDAPEVEDSSEENKPAENHRQGYFYFDQLKAAYEAAGCEPSE